MTSASSGDDRAWEILARSPYVLLTTFRKDGRAVATPVWAAPSDDGRLLVWTAPDAGKVKRIRRSSRVTLVPCSVRGVPIGREIPATARIVDTTDLRPVYRALIAKYGIQAWLTLLPNRVMARLGRPNPAGVLELGPAE